MPFRKFRKKFSRKRKRSYVPNKYRKKRSRRYSYKTKRYRFKYPKKRTAFTKRQRAYLQAALRNAGDQDNVQVYRTLQSGEINSKVNQKLYTEYSFLDRAYIDLALNTYNTPGQPLSGNTQMVLGSTKSLTGTDKNIKTKILSGYFEMKLRNNSTVPVKIRFYHLGVHRRMPQTDGPISEISQGLENSGAGTGTINDLRYSPYDSPQFLRYFKILKVKKISLKVGQEYTYRMRRVKPFIYSPADSINHVASHSDPLYTQWLLIDQEGCIARSNFDSTVGVSEATVDYTIMRQIKFCNVPGKGKSRYLVGAEYLPALGAVPVHRQVATEIAQFTTTIPSLEQIVTATASAPSLVNTLSVGNTKLDTLIQKQEETTEAIEECCDGPPGNGGGPP